MSPPAPVPPDRGAAWVWIQWPLLLGLVAAGPLTSGDWRHEVAFWIGAMLMVIAAGLGLPALAHLGRNRTPYPKPRPGSVLVQHGAYRWMRHPLYTSLLLGAAGWALVWQSAFTAGMAVACAVFFDAKSRSEERHLMEAFPEYRLYRRRVRRFLPGLY